MIKSNSYNWKGACIWGDGGIIGCIFLFTEGSYKRQFAVLCRDLDRKKSDCFCKML